MDSNDEKIWPVLNSIITCERFEQVSEYILQPLTALMHADSAIYIEIMQHKDGRSSVCRNFSYGEKSNIMDQYIRDFYHEDPLIFPATKIQHGMPLNDIQKVQLKKEQGQLTQLDKRTRYYKQFIEANCLEDVLGIIFPLGTEDNRFACIGVHKYNSQSFSRHLSTFKSEDYMTLEKLVRPLGVAFNHIYQKSLGSELKALVSMLEFGSTNTHYIFFDEQMIPRKNSNAMIGQYYSLIMNRINLQNLQESSQNLRSILIDEGMQQVSKSLSLEGFGQVKLIMSKTHTGEMHHLLTWEHGCAESSSENINHGTYDLTELTYREKDVIQQLVMGKSNKLIAHELHISIRTVENHLRSVYEKLGVHTRTQLIHAVHGRLNPTALIQPQLSMNQASYLLSH
ncbi:hypothetical protein B9T31_08735 [Acinetobacter sp. ANC 4558]|uniref:response regulator transcription factor n=1 Tax=Acinetobacter sp. ANC 4558 TaxID=1977876 RepID=UPI000A34A08D|nr:helix-turn-helix transcriptional regulator [Acinetobacter sp. ANC 4558]OTG86116.1 hypothetical protein B9T31_08735 [Acinetobacter sp. ANC 4558]